MTKMHNPGEDNKPAGKYLEVGPRGGTVKDPRIVNIDKGDRLPPTSESGNNWKKINWLKIINKNPNLIWRLKNVE